MRDKQVQPDKVAVYIRWSTDDQAEGTTLEVQREACQHFILSQGWEFREELLFVDDGYSGANIERLGLTRLRELCRRGAVDCVVVYKLDRLSRSVVDTVKLVMEEWDGQVYLKSARESIDTSTPMGKQIFYLLVSYAEWERNVIKDRTSSGKWRRAKEGRCPGYTAPYGYRNAAGAFKVHPEESVVVKHIFQESMAHRSALQIASGLNADGVPGRTGRGWSGSVISRILRNVSYIGVMVYGRTSSTGTKKGAGPRRVRHEDPAVQVPGVFPPLVDEASFAIVQAQLTARRPQHMAPRAASSLSLLTGLAVCGQCGQSMVSHYRWNRKYRYYRCSAEINKGSTYCACGFIPQDEVDEEVRRKVLELYASEERLNRHRALSRVANQEALGHLEAGLRELRSKLESAALQETRIKRAFMSGDIDARHLNDMLAFLEQDQKTTKVEIRHLEQKLAAQEAVIARDDGRNGTLDEAGRWDGLLPPERKALLRSLLATVLLYREKGGGAVSVDLKWRVGEDCER